MMNLCNIILGPHGMELLHVYISEPIQHSEFGDTTPISDSWQLHGLKIIGDPNVPG